MTTKVSGNHVPYTYILYSIDYTGVNALIHAQRDDNTWLQATDKYFLSYVRGLHLADLSDAIAKMLLSFLS